MGVDRVTDGAKIPMPDPGSETPGSPIVLKIKTHEDLLRAIQEHPGLEVDGIGQLPKGPIIDKHHTAYALHPESPTPEDAEDVVHAYREYYVNAGGFSYTRLRTSEHALFDLWKSSMPGTSEKDLLQCIAWRREHIRNTIAKFYSSMTPDELMGYTSDQSDNVTYEYRKRIDEDISKGGKNVLSLQLKREAKIIFYDSLWKPRNEIHQALFDAYASGLQYLDPKDSPKLRSIIQKSVGTHVRVSENGTAKITSDLVLLIEKEIRSLWQQKLFLLKDRDNEIYSSSNVITSNLLINRKFPIKYLQDICAPSYSAPDTNVWKRMSKPSDKFLKTLSDALEARRNKTSVDAFLWYVKTFGSEEQRQKILPVAQQLRQFISLVQNPKDYPSFIGGTRIEDNGYTGFDTYNTLVANPAIPSESGVTFAKDHLRPVRHVGAYADLWRMTQKILQNHNVDPNIWSVWAESLKIPGLSRHAFEDRTNSLEWILSRHSQKSKEDMSPTIYRMPTTLELQQRHIERQQSEKHSRNSAVETHADLVSPIRLDRDSGWDLYDFTPEQWHSLYKTSYNAMKNEYGDRPSTALIKMRTSLAKVLIGEHKEVKRSYPSGADRLIFDEVDALMFLPTIAEENGNDPGFLPLAYKLILQMDDSLRARYANEIHYVVQTLIDQIPSSNALLSPGQSSESDSSGITANFFMNTGDMGEYRDWMKTRLLGYYASYPHLGAHLDYNVRVFYENGKPPHILSEDENRRAKEIYETLENKNFDVATAMALNTKYREGETSVNDVLLYWQRSDEQDFRENITPDCVTTSNSYIWADPNLEVNWRGEVTKIHHTELILRAQASTPDRLREANLRELAQHVEILAERDEESSVRSLATAASIIQDLTGMHVDPTNLASIIASSDHICQIAMRLRGASIEETDALLRSLQEHLPPELLSHEAEIQAILAMSGHMEKAANVATVIRSTAAAFRISVRKILRTLETMGEKRYIQELMDIGMSEEKAKDTAREASFAFPHRNLTDEFATNGADTIQAVWNETPDAKMQKKHYLRTLERGILSTMNTLGTFTNYNYDRTQWLQVMKQVTGKQFEESDGRINLYCVQQSFILYEMLQDAFANTESLQFATPPEIFIGLEEQGITMTASEFFENLKQQSDGGGKQLDMYDHYYVIVRLPTIEPNDPLYYIQLDATENKARLIPESAIHRGTSGELIIEPKKAIDIHMDSGETTVKRPTETQTLRVVLQENVTDQSVNIIGNILGDLPGLSGFRNELDPKNPHTFFSIATNTEEPEYKREAAIESLIHNTPYFLGKQGFSTPSAHIADLVSLLEQSRHHPARGLFIARILAIQYPNFEFFSDHLHTFQMLCAYTPDEAWEKEKEVYKAIVLDEDITFIEKERVKFKSKDLKEQQQEEEQTRTQLNEDLFRVFAQFFAQATFEQAEEFSKEQKQGADTDDGSKLQFLQRTQQLKAEGIISEATLLDGETDVKRIASDVKEKSRQFVGRTIPVHGSSANHVATYLLSNTPEEDISATLRRYRALFRAYVVDLHALTPRELDTAWHTFNASIKYALEQRDARLRLSSPDSSEAEQQSGGVMGELGSLEELLTMKKSHVLSDLSSHPALGNDPRAMLKAFTSDDTQEAGELA